MREPADNNNATLTRRPTGTGTAGDPGYLLVFSGESSAIFQIPRAEQVLEVVIGRMPEAELRIDDPTASRRHAKLLVEGSGAVLHLLDLGSHNGTRVNGELVSQRIPRPINSGDVITVCDVTMVLKRGARPRSTGALSGEPGPLLQRLEEEIDRAQLYGRKLALLCVDTAGAAPAMVAAALSGRLRTMDRAALSPAGELLILLPELDEEEAKEVASVLSEVLCAAAPGVRLGLALCPEDGGDVDTLLSAARAATVEAQPGALQATRDTATVLTAGEHRILIADPAMARLYQLIERLAKGTLPVLICGETGTGKELAAGALHHWSKRQDGPLVTVNCAALAEGLVESTLFGHEKGAFTGATERRAGVFETAAGGTLFLDEVGELPLATQAKLLRVLEQKRVTRVGSTRELQVDVRLVAATNRDLEAEVKTGHFRQDLYFRLSAATVMMVPLRDRQRELPHLARSFLATACARAERAPMIISDGAMHRLQAYAWPGNIRELRNVIEYLATVTPEPVVLPCHLPARVTGEDAVSVSEPTPSGVQRFRPIEEELHELERTRMMEAIQAAGGLQNRAAELLAMPLRTFTGKVKLYGLSRRAQKA